MEFKPTLLALLILGVSACDRPMDNAYVVDGTRNAGFSQDLAQCKRLAEGYKTEDLRTGAIAGGVIGGAAGALDADDGDKLETAAAGAAIGALVGAGSAKAELEEKRRDVVIRCMQGRNHRVVG